MRKTLTFALQLLAASLMSSFNLVAQRPYIPDEPLQYYPQNQDQGQGQNQGQNQNQGQSQYSSVELQELRAIINDDPAANRAQRSRGEIFSTPAGGANSSNPNTYNRTSNQNSNTYNNHNTPAQTNYNGNGNNAWQNPNSSSRPYYNQGQQPVEVITHEIQTPIQSPYIEEVNTQDPRTSQGNDQAQLYDLMKLLPVQGGSSNGDNQNDTYPPTNTASGNYNNGTPTNGSYSNNGTQRSYNNTSSSSTTYSNSPTQSQAIPYSRQASTSQQANNQSNIVVYPKIRATVGSEIIVEPAQAIHPNPSQWNPSQQPAQSNVQQPTNQGNNFNYGDNGYYNGNGNYTANPTYNPGYVTTDPTVKTPKVSELYTIVDGDTVSMILPQKNLGRFDRGLYNYLYIPKGRWAFGLTASYGEFSTEDVQLLNILKDFDVKGKLYSIKPFITYFFRNNQSMGMRLNYTRGEADLSSMVFDFDDDMSFDLKDVSYYYEGYSMSVFYRNYVGLDQNKRFSVFNDVDLSFSSGSSRFKRYYDQVTRDTQTTSMGVALNFSPGVCIFIMDNAAFNVSFGVFGVSMHKDKQITDGVEEGSRFSSGANFKFNLFNINFGLMIVI